MGGSHTNIAAPLLLRSAGPLSWSSVFVYSVMSLLMQSSLFEEPKSMHYVEACVIRPPSQEERTCFSPKIAERYPPCESCIPFPAAQGHDFPSSKFPKDFLC